MEYFPDKKEIILNRIPSNLDKFVIEFIKVLEKNLEYVLVSGYVSIITGRSRATEDVDLLIPKMDFDNFQKFWENSEKAGFECINTNLIEEAYKLLEDHAIRFAKKGTPVPNMEFKLMNNGIHNYSFENKIKVRIKGSSLFISPIEMQIAYKLSLGSDKDLEDAKHLYELFKNKLNKEELLKLIKKLKAEVNFEKIK